MVIRKSKRRIIIVILITIIVLLSFIFRFYFVKMFRFFDCANEIVKTLSLKEGEFNVFAFLRNCGATTAYSIHVSILPKNEKLQSDNVGNVFCARRASFIDIEFDNKNNLIIYYDCPEEHIITKVHEYQGVSIKPKFRK